MHAGRTLQDVGASSRNPEREGNAIRPLRHPEGISAVYNLGGLGLAVGVANILSHEYLSDVGQEDLRHHYLSEILPINKQIQNVKVSADWC